MYYHRVGNIQVIIFTRRALVEKKFKFDTIPMNVIKNPFYLNWNVISWSI